MYTSLGIVVGDGVGVVNGFVVGLGVAVGVGACVGVGVGLIVGFAVGVGDKLGVELGVGKGEGVGSTDEYFQTLKSSKYVYEIQLSIHQSPKKNLFNGVSLLVW